MKLTVNGKVVEAQAGETLLTVLRREGIHVPTLCHMEGMIPTGACRICVLEVEGQGNLIPSCSFPAADGMKERDLRCRKRIAAASRGLVWYSVSRPRQSIMYRSDVPVAYR